MRNSKFGVLGLGLFAEKPISRGVVVTRMETPVWRRNKRADQLVHEWNTYCMQKSVPADSAMFVIFFVRQMKWMKVLCWSIVGVSTGGVSTGGVSTGGVSTGGVSTGGVSTGGVSTGGVSTGGVSTGGVSTGGVSTGGVSTGGVSTGVVTLSLCCGKQSGILTSSLLVGSKPEHLQAIGI